MNIIRKDASITNTGADDDFPGSFEVILSAPTEDRDGDTYLPDEWKLPLPDHITFDSDHGMSVGTTVGSGVPSIDEATGNLVVSGTYSSLPRAQDVKTLVNEGHIRTTSVASMAVPGNKSANGKAKRELLNGAFVAVPSNREALVLSSKSLTAKAGARNSSSDSELIQTIHDAALALGADPGEASEKRAARAQLKSMAGSVEALKDRIMEALQVANGAAWIWIRGTIPGDGSTGTVVFEVENPVTYDSELFQQSYEDDGTTVTLQGDRAPVGLTEIVTPTPDATKASTSPDGTTKTPAAGAPAPAAGDSEAPSGDEAAAEVQVRAARIRVMQQIATATESERH